MVVSSVSVHCISTDTKPARTDAGAVKLIDSGVFHVYGIEVPFHSRMSCDETAVVGHALIA